MGSSVSLLGLVVALITATSYSRALERMYAKVWQVKRPGLHAAWRWLATVLAVILAVGLLGLTREATEGVPLPALWDFVRAHDRLDGRVDVRAVGAPARRDPRACARVHGRRHGVLHVRPEHRRHRVPADRPGGGRRGSTGVLGLVFAYIGWLFAFSFALVLATVVGRACAEDEGALGRLVRGPSQRRRHRAARPRRSSGSRFRCRVRGRHQRRPVRHDEPRRERRQHDRDQQRHLRHHGDRHEDAEPAVARGGDDDADAPRH